MADSYTNTSEHYIPVPAITDKFSFTRDIQALRERLNKGMAGLAAYYASADNYVLAATNAGKILSSVAGGLGRIIPKTTGADPTLTFQLHTGAALSDVWTVGVDDSDSDSWKIENAATLGSGAQFKLQTNGDATIKGLLATHGAAPEAGVSLTVGAATGSHGYLRFRGPTINEGNLYHDATYAIHMDSNGNTLPIRIDGSYVELGKYLVLNEITAPSGTANQAKLFAVDNGSGKTVLKVIFGTGVAQVLATEP